MIFLLGYFELSFGRKLSVCFLNMWRLLGGLLSLGVYFLIVGRWLNGMWKIFLVGFGRIIQFLRRIIWIVWSICGGSVVFMFWLQLRILWKVFVVRFIIFFWSMLNGFERSILLFLRKIIFQRRWRFLRWSFVQCIVIQFGWLCLYCLCLVWRCIWRIMWFVFGIRERWLRLVVIILVSCGFFIVIVVLMILFLRGFCFGFGVFFDGIR